MRILIFHGYLLGGTGSNVYNARLAEALVGLGHEVHLFSQDRHPERHSFVDAVGDWEGRASCGCRRCLGRVGPPDRPGLHRLPAGHRGLLPVYVADRCEGIEARTFERCSDQEVMRYLDANGTRAARSPPGCARRRRWPTIW
jgi:hypothetical protein